jgi:DNA-binding GntR family transcriptional regulator
MSLGSESRSATVEESILDNRRYRMAATDDTLIEQIPSPHRMIGRTVHERVLAALRTAVVDGVLPAGYHLRQTDIANTMQVSVTPVREALRDLAGEGLVRLDAHRGAVVVGIELDDFIEIRLLLDTLWPVLARLAAERVTEPEIAAMWDLQRRIEAEPSAYMTYNPMLHDMIAAAARAPRITAIIGSLRVATDRVLHQALGTTAPHRLHEGIEEHRPILAALEARDPDALVAAVMAHQKPTWDAVEASIRTSEGDPS